MKKILMALGLTLVIVGCNNAQVEKKEIVKPSIDCEVQEKETVLFKRADNKEIFSLISEDCFETAVMNIENRKIPMKIAVSGSGLRMIGENEEAEIHFKADSGILTIDGTDVEVSVIKQ